MTEKEYRKFPALNYSLLADFNVSQDHVLLPRKQKAYFEDGKAFELLVQDAITGSKLFEERFFIANVPGDPPDALITAIQNNEDLSQFEVLTKKMERSQTYKRQHAWMDACLDERPGLYPIGQDKIAMLNQMLDNFLVCQFEGIPLPALLAHAKWQVPIVWDNKKALVDCYSIIPTDPFSETRADEMFLFDIKTAANFAKFEQMYWKRYFLQDLHYSEGIKFQHPELINRNNMIFLVSSKEPPYLTRSYTMDSLTFMSRQKQYDTLCENCAAWDKAGRLSRGWLDTKVMSRGY